MLTLKVHLNISKVHEENVKVYQRMALFLFKLFTIKKKETLLLHPKCAEVLGAQILVLDAV